jgi:hypothetical protein
LELLEVSLEIRRTGIGRGLYSSHCGLLAGAGDEMTRGLGPLADQLASSFATFTMDCSMNLPAAPAGGSQAAAASLMAVTDARLML